jgi:lysine 2,3-aminomutase
MCIKLYRVGVIPHYLYHFMPFSPGLANYRTDVRTGWEIIKQMKRRITNLAVPEYVLPHSSGKYTLPLELESESLPVFKQDDNGCAVVEFINWKGERVHYSNVC